MGMFMWYRDMMQMSGNRQVLTAENILWVFLWDERKLSDAASEWRDCQQIRVYSYCT